MNIFNLSCNLSRSRLKSISKLLISSIFGASLVFFSQFSPAQATVYYGNGYYTNLCGTGTAATHLACSGNCNTSSGNCSASGDYVVKYTCGGNLTECRSDESSFSNSQSLSGTSCGKTVQIDVFNKNCRAGGGWSCSDNADGSNDYLKDYMVWYSGDCPVATPTPQPTATPQPTVTPQPTTTPQPTPTLNPTATPKPTETPTPTPSEIPQKSSCDDLEVVAGNNSLVPATITFRASASDNKGNIQRYRYFFGDGEKLETTAREVTHTYESSGYFRARVEAKDSRGNWKTSYQCKAKVRVKPSRVESHKSDCSDVYILEGYGNQAPTTARFEVTGWDNKGDIQRYKIDFGNGVVKESKNSEFEQHYESAGTYTIRGYVQDSQGNWKGGDSYCKDTLSVSTKPITKQPETGTPTAFSVLSLLSGVVGYAIKKAKLSQLV